MPAPLGFALGEPVTSKHMPSLPWICILSTWTVLPTHLPKCPSSFILSPCACSPGGWQCPSWPLCSVEWLFAASDHGFSMSLHSWVSDSR